MIGVYGDRCMIACDVFSGCTWYGWNKDVICTVVKCIGVFSVIRDGNTGKYDRRIEGGGIGNVDSNKWMDRMTGSIDSVVWNGL